MANDHLSSKHERSKPALRPSVRGTHGMVSSGHHLATLAGLRILERGGNAVDAGVAAGICLGILQSDIVNFGGVAPMLIHLAGSRKVKSISGLGRWPRLATVDYFVKNHKGTLPNGPQRSVIPAAPDAWILALRKFGTMTYEDVTRDAIELAEHGFPMHHFMSNNVKEEQESYRRWPSTATIYLPGGKPPEPGDVFRNRDLAETMRTMVRAERRKRFAGRDAALQAARDAFYKGEIAETILAYHKQHDGLFRREDLASYKSEIEDAPMVTYRGYDVFACGPWCQGPALLEALNLVEGFDLRALGHNSVEYVHSVVESLKLAFSDRDRYVGDPDFVQVPMAGLLSKAYARARRGQIDPRKAWREMPEPGAPWKWETGPRKAAGGGRRPERLSAGAPGDTGDRFDTSYVCVMDQWGNAFSATPSDSCGGTPIIPGLGIICSGRGSQSWVDKSHTSSIAPGKRPRLTPSPALAMKEGRPFLAFGTPGGDVQIQAMLQFFVNIVDFGMEPQEAVEAPRFATYNFPSSFYPHAYNKGLLRVEDRVDPKVLETLARRGNTVEPWADYSWRAGGVCGIVYDAGRGVLSGAADPRREGYAIGW
ncbi:MAG: gamma-glutamyltransferase family protein [Candidatus Lambdaproteobacteria bacterium]|nr:gamma-glutamyltransferase family protein [Candidatus Lambdaproteobacteria bacterium]